MSTTIPDITADGLHSNPGINAVHEELCGWFLGPRAENVGLFKKIVANSIDQHVKRRLAYQPGDPSFITPGILASPAYKKSVGKLEEALRLLDGGLSEGTIPVWSGRYNAHMTNDTTMAGMLGYWSTMLSNPNNVAMEASPFTGMVEKYAGLQLANLIGFNIGNRTILPNDPMSWGHITSGGTVANLEAMWAARNLKYYPFSLKNAINGGNFPPTVGNTFTVKTCQQKTVKFIDLSTWDMLNLEVQTILEIPTRLKVEYNITPDFLATIMHKYSVQTVGKQTIEQQYKIVPPKATVPSTRHYSWPKAAAVLGIGEENIVNVPVDNHARVDMKELERELRKVKNRELQAVYMVVVVVGSTEEGSVDPVDAVIKLREKLQKDLGMSFVIHVDAAWGGYFKSMIDKTLKFVPVKGDPEYTGILPLRDVTQKNLDAIGKADSVTIDPHKSGYIPYPAGALCYRDERMKYLVTWDSPYISTQAGVEEIGIYGIEGSKPGAAAVATALSNYVIGMRPQGYGKLLGQASFACSMFSAYWATMDSRDFVVVPFNMLREEPQVAIERYGTSGDVIKIRKYIRDNIIGKSDFKLKDDKVAMTLLQNIGSELIINAFACNFYLENDQVWNQDVEEANYLNTCIAQRLRIVPGDLPLINKTKFFITSTIFLEEQYGKCADTFKTRLGLKGAQDLFVLRNVVMSAFVTSPVSANTSLLMDLMKEFKTVADEEAIVRRRCNAVGFKDTQQFIMQGIQELHLVYQHLFHKAGHREQIVIAVTIPETAMSKYRDARKDNPKSVFFLNCKEKQSITEMLDAKQFAATFVLVDFSAPIEVTVTVTKIVKRRPINYKSLRKSMPMEYLPFYLYGNEKEMHIDHMLIEAPSMQFSADRVQIDETPAGNVIRDNVKNGLIAIVYNSGGLSMPPWNEIHLSPILVGAKLVHIYKDPNTQKFDADTLKRMLQTPPLAKGRITCNSNVFIDNISPNQIPVPKPDIEPLKNRGPPKTNESQDDTLVRGMADNFLNMLRADMGLKPQNTRISDMYRFKC